MATFIQEFGELVWTDDGRKFHARAYTDKQSDHPRLWEAWIEFVPVDGGERLATGVETTQPSLEDVFYWASGIEATYLDGALERAKRATAVHREHPAP